MLVKRTTDKEGVQRISFFNVPKGIFADAAADERKKIRQALLQGNDSVSITSTGNPKPTSEVKPGDGPTINAPKGKLACIALYLVRMTVDY